MLHKGSSEKRQKFKSADYGLNLLLQNYCHHPGSLMPTPSKTMKTLLCIYLLRVCASELIQQTNLLKKSELRILYPHGQPQQHMRILTSVQLGSAESQDEEESFISTIQLGSVESEQQFQEDLGPQKQSAESDLSTYRSAIPNILPSFNQFSVSGHSGASLPLHEATHSDQSPNTSSKTSFQSDYQFSQVELFHRIPNNFIEGELFQFYGRVKQQQLRNIYDQKVVSVVFTDSQLFKKITFTHRLSDSSDGDFSIQAQIPKAGSYRLSIFYGLNGRASNTLYSVQKREGVIQQSGNSNEKVGLPEPHESLNVNFEFRVEENQLYMQTVDSFVNGASPYIIYCLKFWQEGNSLSKEKGEVTLYFSNYNRQHERIQIPYYKFSAFNKTFTKVQISQGFSEDSSMYSLATSFSIVSTLSFFATQHHFFELKQELVDISPHPISHFESVGSVLSIKGRTKDRLRNEVVLLEPGNVFKEYQLNRFLKANERIPSNSSVDLSLRMNLKGTYILEINHDEGFAVLNKPIYVGERIFPLLPDFEDLRRAENINGQNSNSIPSKVYSSLSVSQLRSQRMYMLQLINQKRREFNQRPLILDDRLNLLAQTHAVDMINRNYISHYTPEGKGPSQRARDLGIYEQVSENAALNTDLEEAHQRIIRSNIHLRNMVSSHWERLGLGIERSSSNGSYVLVEEYSTRSLENNPFQKSEIRDLKYEVMQIFIDMSEGRLTEINWDLCEQVQEYQRLVDNEEEALEGVKHLGDYLKSLRKYRRWAYSSLNISYKEGFMEVLREQTFVLPKTDKYTQIGVSIKYEKGELRMLFAFV